MSKIAILSGLAAANSWPHYSLLQGSGCTDKSLH